MGATCEPNAPWDVAGTKAHSSRIGWKGTPHTTSATAAGVQRRSPRFRCARAKALTHLQRSAHAHAAPQCAVPQLGGAHGGLTSAELCISELCSETAPNPHTCDGTGLGLHTSALGLGLLTLTTSATGLGSPLPHLQRDFARIDSTAQVRRRVCGRTDGGHGLFLLCERERLRGRVSRLYPTPPPLNPHEHVRFGVTLAAERSLLTLAKSTQAMPTRRPKMALAERQCSASHWNPSQVSAQMWAGVLHCLRSPPKGRRQQRALLGFPQYTSRRGAGTLQTAGTAAAHCTTQPAPSSTGCASCASRLPSGPPARAVRCGAVRIRPTRSALL